MTATSYVPVRRVTLLAAATCCALALGSRAHAGGSWLDRRPIAAWNKSGAALPKAPHAKPGTLSMTTGPCKGEGRKAAGEEDRAVTSAGWTLVGAKQSSAGIVVGGGAVGADSEMACRPIGYHLFVFSDGKFAGTVSPVPMDARTDGDTQGARIVGPARLEAEFFRYAPNDPMCCPSRTSHVSYELRRESSGPVLVPTAVTTRDS